MPFQPGQLKPPGSGRKPGTPNRRSFDVTKLIEKLGCDPLDGMAELANDVCTQSNLRFAILKELAQYVHSKPRLGAETVDSDLTDES